MRSSFTARVELSYRYSFQACLFSLQGWGLIDLLLRATFSPALPSDCFAIDFPGRAIGPCEALPILATLSKGAAKAALDCAHRTSTVLSCAFCEQGGHLAAPSLFLYFLLLFPYFTLRPLPQPDYIILVLEPDQRADEERKD